MQRKDGGSASVVALRGKTCQLVLTALDLRFVQMSYKKMLPMLCMRDNIISIRKVFVNCVVILNYIPGAQKSSPSTM